MRPKLKKALFYVVAVFLACCAFEGFLNLGFTVVGYLKTPVIAEKRHVRYDPELGWAHVPGVRISGMYGAGKDLTINGQGFRGPKEYTREVPPGKTRVMCLGDSFVLGFGAPDNKTIPQYLEKMDSGLETINMGQGGYGLDQIYLWYIRERQRFDHDVLLVSYIDQDIARMNWRVFSGYNKPFLKLENGNLRICNVPVPKSGQDLAAGLDNLLRGTAIHRLATMLVRGIAGPRQFYTVYDSEREILDTALAVFENLRAWTRSQGITLVIWRPLQRPEEGSMPIMAQLGQELKKRGFVFFDLMQDAASIPQDKLDSLFISRRNADPALLHYMTFEGHYTDLGNQVVSAMLLHKLAQNSLLHKKDRAL